MLLLLVALLAKPPEREPVIYYCKSSQSAIEFSLAYDQRGTKISDVLIVGREIPRLPPDNATRWRAKATGRSVSFRLRHIKNGISTSGEMELAPDPERPGHFRLTWSSMMGGVGGHLQLGTSEQSADCVPEGAAQRQ
jgi:hypothetical protein